MQAALFYVSNSAINYHRAWADIHEWYFQFSNWRLEFAEISYERSVYYWEWRSGQGSESIFTPNDCHISDFEG